MQRPAEISLISRRSCTVPPSSIGFAFQPSGTISEGGVEPVFATSATASIVVTLSDGIALSSHSAAAIAIGSSLRPSSSLCSAELLTEHSTSKDRRTAFPACPSCHSHRLAALNSNAPRCCQSIFLDLFLSLIRGDDRMLLDPLSPLRLFLYPLSTYSALAGSLRDTGALEGAGWVLRWFDVCRRWRCLDAMAAILQTLQPCEQGLDDVLAVR